MEKECDLIKVFSLDSDRTGTRMRTSNLRPIVGGNKNPEHLPQTPLLGKAAPYKWG